MLFRKDESIDITYLLDSSGAAHYVMLAFNATKRTQMVHDVVEKLMKKLNKARYVANASRSGRSKMTADKDMSVYVLARRTTKGIQTSLCANGNQLN